jgi:hypothetical protein
VDEHGSERSLALAGIVGVVLLVVSALIQGSPPKPHDSAVEIAKFLVDKQDQIRWAGFIGALGSIVLLGWVGAVWRLLRRAEGDVPMFAVAATGGAVFALAVVNVSAVLLGVMAIVGPAALGGGDTRTLYLLTNNLIAVGAMGLALFVGAFATVIIQGGVLPRALGWLGGLIAVVLLAAGGGVASTRDVFFVLGFVGFLAFALWTIVVSVLMYRGAGTRTSEPSAVSAA